MSGGHYEYKHYQLNYLADDIEREFINGGKYMDDDFNADIGWNNKRPEIEYDRLDSATDDERIIILKEINQLVVDLRACSDRARELDYLLSSDISPSTYIERLKKNNFL